MHAFAKATASKRAKSRFSKRDFAPTHLRHFCLDYRLSDPSFQSDSTVNGNSTVSPSTTDQSNFENALYSSALVKRNISVSESLDSLIDLNSGSGCSTEIVNSIE
jgi:hypothetical protein